MNGLRSIADSKYNCVAGASRPITPQRDSPYSPPVRKESTCKERKNKIDSHTLTVLNCLRSSSSAAPALACRLLVPCRPIIRSAFLTSLLNHPVLESLRQAPLAASRRSGKARLPELCRLCRPRRKEMTTGCGFGGGVISGMSLKGDWEAGGLGGLYCPYHRPSTRSPRSSPTTRLPPQLYSSFTGKVKVPGSLT